MSGIVLRPTTAQAAVVLLAAVFLLSASSHFLDRARYGFAPDRKLAVHAVAAAVLGVFVALAVVGLLAEGVARRGRQAAFAANSARLAAEAVPREVTCTVMAGGAWSAWPRWRLGDRVVGTRLDRLEKAAAGFHGQGERDGSIRVTAALGVAAVRVGLGMASTRCRCPVLR